MQHDPLEPGKADLSAPSIEREVLRLEWGTKSRRRAWFLSLFGFIPFLVCAVCIWIFDVENPLRPLAIDSLKVYGAIILSFMGGTRWGLAMRSEEPGRVQSVFAYSVIPPLVGWFSLYLPLPYLFGVQALAFAGQGAWDSFAGQQGVFGLWFVKLRTTLTFLVVGSLILAFLSTA